MIRIGEASASPAGKVKINKENVIATVDERLFGGFLEHVGRAVYGGIYEPAHETADESGFRRDVLNAVRDMGVTYVRYPGGNFVSGYHWKDGIGKARPVRLNLAWRELEPNEVGTDEFLLWAQKAGVKPIMAVNMGNGTPEEAAEFVEYCNFSGETYWSERRAENGHAAPYGIREWCIGNEMDGCHQLGALPAREYAQKAQETAKQMLRVDGNLRFIMAGSSSPWSPTFPEWDREVLENTYTYANFLSLHAYYTYKNYGADSARALREFLASPVNFEQYISTVAALCDEVKVKKGEQKDIFLAMDEWNVWHTAEGTERHETAWQVGEKLIENNFDFADALVVSGILSVLVNHSDRVKIACLAQIVNVIAPIMTQKGGGLLKQTTYYPFRLFSQCKNLRALAQEVETDGYPCDYGIAPYLYSCVCYDAERGRYLGYFINTGSKNYALEVDLSEEVVCTKETLFTAGIHEKNTFSAPDRVVPVERAGNGERRMRYDFTLPPYSLTVVEWISKTE